MTEAESNLYDSKLAKNRLFIVNNADDEQLICG